MRTRDDVEAQGVQIRTRITDESLYGLGPFEELGEFSDGAVLIFQGRVRETNDGRVVTGLGYQAYGEMAEKELRTICEEAAGRFEVGAISAAHRVGELDPGEVSVVIGVAAPHRASCYEASRYVIEEIKARLPVWKRERYADGEAVWVGAPASVAAESRPAAETREVSGEGEA